ncbi:MAG: hypothetical protein ACO1Q7_00185 [Gemmatimonas sp.]
MRGVALRSADLVLCSEPAWLRRLAGSFHAKLAMVTATGRFVSRKARNGHVDWPVRFTQSSQRKYEGAKNCNCNRNCNNISRKGKLRTAEAKLRTTKTLFFAFLDFPCSSLIFLCVKQFAVAVLCDLAVSFAPFA